MSQFLNKAKLLAVLRDDVTEAEKRKDANDPNNPREAIIHHICKDEARYAQSIIDVIESGKYDMPDPS